MWHFTLDAHESRPVACYGYYLWFHRKRSSNAEYLQQETLTFQNIYNNVFNLK